MKNNLNSNNAKKLFGAHLSVSDIKNIQTIIELCQITAIQIFISSPRSFNPAISETSKKNIDIIINELKLAASVHMPYLVNFASCDEELRKKSVSQVIYGIKASSDLGVKHYVAHPGSGVYDNLKRSIDEVLDGIDGASAEFLIENTEGSGKKLISTEKEALKLIGDYNGKIGICWDTAHAYGAGVDTSNLSAKLISHIKLVHLNDSSQAVEFGSKKDRHAGFFEGRIGPEKITDFINSLGHEKTYIIEREGFENTCRDLIFIKETL